MTVVFMFTLLLLSCVFNYIYIFYLSKGVTFTRLFVLRASSCIVCSSYCIEYSYIINCPLWGDIVRLYKHDQVSISELLSYVSLIIPRYSSPIPAS